ncbi:hypothetical protein IW150_001754 [Coemansia sp. RSA 2607]|nr:hypothetical protein IW150_001754 [Coemansia sp. RSA 2607]
MPLDVMHAFSKFFRKLPESRVEFEHEMQRFLPVMIDTKYIIESTPAIKAKYGTSSLEEIAPMLERESASISDGSRQLIRHHTKFTREATSSMHEAGYDAYTTGATFIRLLKLEGGLNLSSISSSCESSSELVLYRYINKLYQALGNELYWHFGASENSRSGSESTSSTGQAAALDMASEPISEPISEPENDLAQDAGENDFQTMSIGSNDTSPKLSCTQYA